MKIVYLSNSRLPSETASSVHVMKMCQALASLEFKVILVGLKNKKVNIDDIFNFYNVSNNFNLKLMSFPLPKVNLLFLLVISIINSLKADVIYSRWRIGTFIISLLLKKPIIYEMHLMPHTKLQEKIETYLIRKNKITKFIFITESLKEDYIKKYPILDTKICAVLPDGADIPEDIVKKNINTNKRLQICYVGSFFPGKGIDIVIELSNRVTDADFHIIGGKDEQIKYHKGRVKNNNVFFYGYQSQTTISELLNNMDIGLLPNKPVVTVGKNQKLNIGAWTSPMKMFDYMAHKNAIISSDLKVLKEILIDNYNARLVSHNDISKWVAIIEELNDNRSEIKKLTENAFMDIKNKYSWKKRAEKALLEWISQIHR